MKTNIVGTEFAKAKADGIEAGMSVGIRHDKDNKFDKNALGVYFNDERIGYIGKNSDIYDLDRVNFPKIATINDFYIKSEDDEKFKRHEVGCLVSCTIEIENSVEIIETNNVLSFNEEDVVINFNEDTHTYTDKNGNKLMGATTYIKKYIIDFDADTIIPRCVVSWGVPKKTIQDAWDLGRDLAGSFGTGIHKALEFEDLYRNHEKKNGDRCFNIKHPVIKRIVNEFFDFYDTLGFKGEVIPEALISDAENGHCALADRVLVTSWEKKTCRLQDYKVNHSFTKNGAVNFKGLPMKLPTTKLSKLALQLKFQAQMLEKSGWTIEGMDGFVFDSEWRYYEVDMLDGFDIINGKIK